jgi:multidrug efflux system membrane fusion protein
VDLQMDGTRGEITPGERVGEPPDTSVPPKTPQTTPVPPQKSGGWISWVVTLMILGGIGYASYRYIWPLLEPASKTAAGRAGNGGPPQPVGAATIGRADVHVVLNALGTVTPLATVTVKTQINGQLSQVAFTEGQMVKKGDFLAQIDPRPYQVALETAQAALARDQATLKGAQIDLARYRKLVAQDSLATQTLDDQTATVATDQGTVQSDMAAIDSAKLNLVYCHIVSPVDGRVGLRQVDAGNYVQTSDTNGIVVITQLEPMSVLFSLPEDAIPQIQKQTKAGAKLSVAAYDRADVTKLADGQLQTIDNQVDTTTGTFKLRAIFQNTDDTLFPNQFVNAKLLVDTLKNVIVAPTAAIQNGAPGTFVYVIGADSLVHVTPVKLGHQDGEVAEVVSGLKGGERVVIDGADRLKDGAKVSVPAANAITPGAAGPGSPPAHRKAAASPSTPGTPAAPSTPGAAVKP